MLVIVLLRSINYENRETGKDKLGKVSGSKQKIKEWCLPGKMQSRKEKIWKCYVTVISKM